LYCYASACSQNYVRDIFQALYRVRDITDKELYFNIDSRHNGLNLSTFYSEIKNEIKRKINMVEQQYEKNFRLDYPYKTPDWLYTLTVYNKLEHNISVMNIKQLFYRYLTECNYNLTEEIIEEIDMFEFKPKNKVKLSYSEIQEITISQVKNLRTKRLTEALTEMEEAQLEKFFFQLCVFELPTEDSIWTLYCDYNRSRFRNLMIEKGINEGKLEIKDVISSSTFSGLESNLGLQVEFIQQIKGWLGINNTQDYGRLISRETLEKTIEKINQNRKNIRDAFKIRDRTDKVLNLKSGKEFISNVFKAWAFSELKSGERKQVRMNGKATTVSPFQIINNALDSTKNQLDVYKCIRPKESSKNKGILIAKK